MVRTFSKESLIQYLLDIKKKGWIESNKPPGNAGAVGNTLETLLGIEENNLPIPNAAEWELKAQRQHTSSLTTLFHMEPSPSAARLIPRVLLPFYGWTHKDAGGKYPIEEKSFRSTTGTTYTDRGIRVEVDRQEQKVKISFNAEKVDKAKHEVWLKGVEDIVGLGPISPQPYWGFKDLEYKAGTKLKNTFYVLADAEVKDGKEFFHYNVVEILTDFSFDGFLDCIEKDIILIDFDARTGHNHGTKFRMKQNCWPKLYKRCKKVIF